MAAEMGRQRRREDFPWIDDRVYRTTGRGIAVRRAAGKKNDGCFAVAGRKIDDPAAAFKSVSTALDRRDSKIRRGDRGRAANAIKTRRSRRNNGTRRDETRCAAAGTAIDLPCGRRDSVTRDIFPFGTGQPDEKPERSCFDPRTRFFCSRYRVLVEWRHWSDSLESAVLRAGFRNRCNGCRGFPKVNNAVRCWIFVIFLFHVVPSALTSLCTHCNSDGRIADLLRSVTSCRKIAGSSA